MRRCWDKILIKDLKKCSYVCENAIKTKMAAIQLGSKDNMKFSKKI